MSPNGNLWAVRRAALEVSPTLRGLEFVEAAPPEEGRALRLALHFVPSSVPTKPAAPPELRPENVRIASPFGERYATRVERISADTVLVHVAGTASDGLGTRYEVRLVGLPEIDSFFDAATVGSVPFPASPTALPPGDDRPSIASERPAIDYLNKDYASFRRLMLAEMDRSVPSWTESNPADLGETLVEALAYAADGLSYFQDAVGTERSLPTARLRVSVRRHLRLAGYRLHEGCNARTWIHVVVVAPKLLPAGTRFLADPVFNALPRVDGATYDGLAHLMRHVFESMHDAELSPERNALRLYAWGARGFALEAGCTRAAVEGHVSGLERGSVVVFESSPPGADQPVAHAVRLTETPRRGKDPLFDRPFTEFVWGDEDALPVPMAAQASDGSDQTLVLGNIVMADHGRRVGGFPLPWAPGGKEPYRPTLPERGVTFAVRERDADPPAPASASLRQKPHQAVAQVWLRTSSPELAVDELWHSQSDLLMAGADTDGFVVEVEANRNATLRFGDGRLGRRPEPGSRVEVSYRIGGGTAGNVAANAISHVVSDDPVVLSARNPLRAVGGQEPQSVAQASLVGPEAHKTRWSLVNEQDYRGFVGGLPEVQGVHVERAWRGGLPSMHVFVQRVDGLPEDETFLAGVAAAVEDRRLVGVPVRIRPPRYVPLGLDLVVSPARGISDWKAWRAALDAFSPANGGFFDPAGFTFGSIVFESQIVEWAMRMPEISSARVRLLEAIGHAREREGAIRLAGSQIPRLFPNAPDGGFGALRIEVGNG